MSDTFDHMVDAYESYDRSYDDGFVQYKKGGGSFCSYNKDPLFYHTKIEIMGVVSETEKSYLFRIGEYEGVWVPKSICKRLSSTSVYVHGNTYRKLKSFRIR